MTTYRCRGSVRGTCAVRHRSIGAAYRHVLADIRDCQRARGYSDRGVVREDGADLSAGELDELWTESGGEQGSPGGYECEDGIDEAAWERDMERLP